MAYDNRDDEMDLQQQLEQQLGGQQPMQQAAPMAPPQEAPPQFGGLGGENIAAPSALKLPGAPKPQAPVNVAQAGLDRGVAPPSAVAGGAAPVGNTAMTGGGDRAAQAAAAAAAGYKDIGSTDALKTGAFTDKLTGFNTGGWGTGERGSGTLKNKFGQIASRFDPGQPGAAKAMMADEDFKSFWPNATIVEHPNQDLIDFDGPGGDDPVDVIKGAAAGGAGEAWAWQPTGGEGGGGGAAGGGGGFDMQSLISGIGGGGDPMAAIQAELAKHGGGGQGDPQSLIDQLLAQQQQGGV